MAGTIEDIAEQLRDDYPFPQQVNVGGVQRDMTQEEYDVRIAEGAASIHEQQLAEDATAEWRQTIHQFVAGKATLEDDLAAVNARISSNTALSAAEVRIGFRDLLQSMLWIAERIEDGTIVIQEPSGG